MNPQKNVKVGDKCIIYGRDEVWTIKRIDHRSTHTSFCLETTCLSTWRRREDFYLFPTPESMLNQSPTTLTWINIKKTKLTTTNLYEETGRLRNLIYNMPENVVNYELIQGDGSWGHHTIVLPDCAEVTIGRTTVDSEQA